MNGPYSPRPYWRVCVHRDSGKRWFWASDFRMWNGRFRFVVVDRDGAKTDRIVFGLGDDLVAFHEARLNLFFGNMETSPKPKPTETRQ